MQRPLHTPPAGSLRNWTVQWPMHRNQVLQWGYWFDQPPVDFSDGVLEGERASPIAVTVLDPVAEPAPVAPAAHTAPVTPVAPATPVTPATAVATPAAEPLASPRSVDPVASLQARLDHDLGAGAVSVELMPGSNQLMLTLDRAPLVREHGVRLWAVLRECMPEAQLRWMQAALLHACRFEIDSMPPDAAFQQATAITVQSSRQDPDASADWQALWLRLQLRWLERQGTAARLLGLVRLRASHALLSRQDALPVQLAWLDTLHAWAASQQGPAALARLADAEALCGRLLSAPATTALGQRCLAATLQRRALLERGEARIATLRRAAGLVSGAAAGEPRAAAGPVRR